MTFHPLICQNCGNQIISATYSLYVAMIKKGVTPEEALDKLGIKNIDCCRTLYLVHIDYTEELIT